MKSISGLKPRFDYQVQTWKWKAEFHVYFKKSTVLHIINQVLILVRNHGNHRNWVPFMLFHNLCLIFMWMKQKKIEKIENWWIQKVPQFSFFHFFCFVSMNFRHKLWSSMDETQFLWLPRFLAKINTCLNSKHIRHSVNSKPYSIW